MRAGKTKVITVSLPVRLAAVLDEVCEQHDLHRSQFIATAIKISLERLGVKVGENNAVDSGYKVKMHPGRPYLAARPVCSILQRRDNVV